MSLNPVKDRTHKDKDKDQASKDKDKDQDQAYKDDDKENDQYHKDKNKDYRTRPTKTSSSAMAERPREIDQRFQVGVNLRLNYRLKGYFSRHCDMTQFTLTGTHHMVNITISSTRPSC